MQVCSGGFPVNLRSRPRPPYDARITDASPFAAVATAAAPTTTEFPLDPAAGVRFEDPEQGAGRFALVYAPHREGPRMTLVVEQGTWSVAVPLTSGQLHRLTNGLAGRGTRNAIRPLSVDEQYVRLAGSPTTLTVEAPDRTVEIPAGPRRFLSKTLRALEAKPLLG